MAAPIATLWGSTCVSAADFISRKPEHRAHHRQDTDPHRQDSDPRKQGFAARRRHPNGTFRWSGRKEIAIFFLLHSLIEFSLVPPLSYQPLLSANARSSLPKANDPPLAAQQEPVMVRDIATFAWVSLFSLCAASTAFAESPGHPRVNEINHRVATQQSRIAAGVAHGQIGPWQARRDVAVDARVSRQLSRDEAMHDGHVTPIEQLQLNRELDRNSIRIYDQRN
jgi:hypothetical protein